MDTDEIDTEDDSLTAEEINQICLNDAIKSELDSVCELESLASTNEIRLDEKVSVFLAVALEDSITELLILRSCNGHLSKSDESSGGNQIAKMNGDREYLTKTLIKLYLELKHNLKYTSLNTQLADIAGKAYQSLARELRHKENLRKLKYLRRRQQKETEINRSLLFNCDLQIYKLRDEIEDAVRDCEAKQRYTDSHELARLEEHFLKIEEEEKICSDSIADVKKKIDDEIEVNCAIEKFMKNMTEELEEKISSWRVRYKEESEEIDNKILEFEGLREIQMQKMLALQKTLEEHRTEIQSWKTIVQEREQRLQHEKLLQKSAVSIQAWWRGLMVRRRLAAKRAKENKRKSAKKKK